MLALSKLPRTSHRIAIESTDEVLTPQGGSVFVAGMAERLGLPRMLSERISLKRRRRGASDAQMLLSAIYSLAAGDGALRGVDRLGHDQARLEAVGLEEVPGSRRLGEYLARFDEDTLDELGAIARAVATRVAPEVVSDLVKTRGYVPVFVDGTAIEVDGSYVEGVRHTEESYVVVRSHFDGTQRRLTPRHIFILVSRTDLSLRELVRRHREKQGQENVQKGPLIDLDLHHPPCQKLDANRAFYTCGQLAQLLLIAAQYHLLPQAARRHGLRTLIRDLVTAARLVRHGRKVVLKFAKTALRLDWLIHAADRLDALPQHRSPPRAATLDDGHECPRAPFGSFSLTPSPHRCTPPSPRQRPAPPPPPGFHGARSYRPGLNRESGDGRAAPSG